MQIILSLCYLSLLDIMFAELIEVLAYNPPVRAYLVLDSVFLLGYLGLLADSLCSCHCCMFDVFCWVLGNPTS